MKTQDIYIKSQTPVIKEDLEIVEQFSETSTNFEILSPKSETAVNDNMMLPNNSILVIENDEISALIFKELLNRKSITYTFVSNLEDGINEIEKQSFHTIFFSINNPPNFEYDLIKINKTKYKTINSIWIGLTTKFTRNTISKDQKDNFNKLLIIPYNIVEIEKLFSKIQNSASDKKQFQQKNDPTFNLDQLKQVSNNNPEFILKMLNKFLITALECDEVMTAPILSGYFEKTQKVSHKCIPSYSVMGSNKLVKYLEYIEQNAIVGEKTNSLHEIIQLFMAGNKILISDIRDFLKQK